MDQKQTKTELDIQAAILATYNVFVAKGGLPEEESGLPSTTERLLATRHGDTPHPREIEQLIVPNGALEGGVQVMPSMDNRQSRRSSRSWVGVSGRTVEQAPRRHLSLLPSYVSEDGRVRLVNLKGGPVFINGTRIDEGEEYPL